MNKFWMQNGGVKKQCMTDKIDAGPATCEHCVADFGTKEGLEKHAVDAFQRKLPPAGQQRRRGEIQVMLLFPKAVFFFELYQLALQFPIVSYSRHDVPRQ